MIQNDILIELDLEIRGGDIFIGPSDDNNSMYITFAQKGQFRTAPVLGVGILNFMNAPDSSGRALAKAIRQEHDRDGYKVTTLEIDTDQDGNQELSIKSTKVRM